LSGNKFETTATECSKWEEWLHDAVDEANDVADKLDWSTEQVLAYAILQARSSAYEECAKLIEEGFEKIVGEPYRDDGIPSKNDKCPHGRYMYEDCEQCCVDAIRSKANQ